jgi:2-polyprenyl-3-methyl-5-hydroxy-6-metoxy-1,4-benzoquinol methylase
VVWSVLKLLPYAIRRPFWDPKSVFCHSLTGLSERTVDRERFLLDLCRGKRVLHFGFVDAPFSEERTKSGQLLHLKLRQTAAYMHGVDIDENSIALYRQITGDMDNSVVDIITPREGLEGLANQFDLILFPEVLEHLINPGLALANLRQLCQLNPGAKLCITTPNAFSVAAFLSAIRDYELVHPDHYFYFSPTTLRKLLTDSGFSNIELLLYSGGYLFKSPGLSKHGVIALCSVAT